VEISLLTDALSVLRSVPGAVRSTGQLVLTAKLIPTGAL